MAVCLMMMATAVVSAQMKFEIYYTQVINERGELADYALECLGQDNAILTSDTVYTLDKISKPATKPANTNTAPQQQPKPQNKDKASHNRHTAIPKYAPLNEEAAHAASPAKKAAAVASQIFRLRETRNDILSGEVEHAPADGKAMSIVLDEIKKQERALVELFLGRKTTIRKKETIQVNVDSDELEINKAIARFSADKGIVAINDTTGEPIMLSIQRYTQRVLAAEQPKKKKAEPIYETRIVRSNVQVSYDGNILFERVYKDK